jgi:hypothetical protein
VAPALCRALLRHVYIALCGGRWLYALAALHENDPLSAHFADHHTTSSFARLYEVEFAGSPRNASRPPASANPRVEFALT